MSVQRLNKLLASIESEIDLLQIEKRIRGRMSNVKWKKVNANII